MLRIVAIVIALLVFISIASAKPVLSTSDYVAIVFMSIAAILITILIFMIINHHVKQKEKLAADPRVYQLRKYFKESLDNGFTKKQLIDAAFQHNLPANIIESAMKGI